MKKVWLCGSQGMLGSHFNRLLRERKMHFVGTTKDDVDITNLESTSDFVKEQRITHIINCAAYTQVDKAESEQREAYMVNAIGPYHLGVAGRKHRARVLHFSTDYVFDGKGKAPYKEIHNCSPINAYGISKLAGEMKLLEEHEHACVIRTSWLFGVPGKNFVETMVRLMREKEQLSIVYDQVGRPTYCQDLAEVALDLLDEEGIFHFANTFQTSWFQYAQEIEQQARHLHFPLKVNAIEPISSREYPALAERPAYSTLNTHKIESLLGRKIRPWQEALHDYLLLLKHPERQ